MRVPTIFSIVLLVSGCSTTAMIYLKDGTSIEGRIKRSDQPSIYVATEDSGELITIDRSNIEDIDHPGDIYALVGTVLGVLGWAAVIVAAVDDATCEGMFCGIGNDIVRGVGLAVGIPSTAVSIWGWSVWGVSRFEATYDGPKIAPLAMTDGERTYYGVGMRWSW